jgi:putative ABC transport system substrate-binding protein
MTMRRRDFIAALGGAAAFPLAARGQQASIGFLHSGLEREWTYALAAFHDGLKAAGYTDKQNVTIEYRWADDQYDRLPALAADLVGRKNSAIVAGGGTLAALAAKRATSTIPIVIAVGSDPVKMGLVASLNRPGGNVTGVSFLLNALVAKRLELLRELVPAARLIGIITNPQNPNAENDLKETEAAARTLSLHTVMAGARSEAEMEAAFEALRRQSADALIFLPDPNFLSRRNQIVALAARYKLPTMYFGREFATAGGLMSYSTSLPEAYRLAAGYVSRILKGEKPAELPVLQPTKFEFVINLTTAKALGLDVPPFLQQRADEVIE